MKIFWGKDAFQFLETIWYKEKSPVSTTNTIYATHYHLYAVATTDEKTNVKEDESSVKTGTVSAGADSATRCEKWQRGRSNISYMRWRGTITGERDRGKRTVKKKRWRKHATRSRHYIKIWFAPYRSDGFVVIGHDLCAQEPDDLQPTSPRLAHTFIISDYVN